MIAALLLLATRATLGVYGGWGAFREGNACWAIARPVTAQMAGRRDGAFAAIGDWPALGLHASLHVRLSAVRDRSAGVTLSVGDRRFALVARGRDAFAADAASDRAIVAALRSARSMSIEGVAAGGRPFADSYALAGAATAIDAARIACLGVRR